MNEYAESLARTSWNCECRIVFAPKYRRKVYGEKRRGIGQLLFQLKFAISRPTKRLRRFKFLQRKS